MTRSTFIVFTLFVGVSPVFAWPWSKSPVDRPLNARTKEEFVQSVAELKPEISAQDYQRLISAFSWLCFYEGAIVGAGGRYDPELGWRRFCEWAHRKSAKDIVLRGDKLAREAPRILAAYKHYLATGSP
jgi:hypothetical protein